MLVLRSGTKRLPPAARPVVAKTPLGLPVFTGAGGALAECLSSSTCSLLHSIWLPKFSSLTVWMLYTLV